MNISTKNQLIEDWKKFNSFNWHPKTDVRIAQELYVTYLSLFSGSTLDSDKEQFIYQCIYNKKNGLIFFSEASLNEKIFKQHIKRQNLPECLYDILSLARVFEVALKNMQV